TQHEAPAPSTKHQHEAPAPSTGTQHRAPSIEHSRGSNDPNRHPLNRVISVAQAVPCRRFRLRAICKVGGTGADGHRPGLVDAGNQLPPLPTVAATLSDEAGLLPAAI